MIFNLISSLFIIAGVVCILNLTPEEISNDLLRITKKKVRLRDRVKTLRTGKYKKSIGERLVSTQVSLEAMGKGSQFAFVVCTSLILIVVGAVTAVILNNLFLLPTFAAFFGIIPFVYVRSSLAKYEKHISDELETTLSVITTSYERNPDLIGAVEENLNQIRPPLRMYFTEFVAEASISNVKNAIHTLKEKIDDDIFHEWCDALIGCQDDNTLISTLQPIVTKLSDIRLVNSELSSMMAAVRMEYYTMVGLVVGNVPLLYLLNKDWFHTLVYETAGKATLGVCGAVILITYIFMLKFTQPVKFKG